jgi:hypothetical protein
VFGGLAADSIDGLLTIVVAVDSALFAVLLGLSLWLVRHPDAEADANPVDAPKHGSP